jgi:hypothetical protein
MFLEMKFGRIIMKQSKEEEEEPEFESRLHLCRYHVQSEEKEQLEVRKCESLKLELKLAQQESCDLYQQLQVRSLVHLPGHILLYNDIWMWLGNCCNGHGTCHIRWILLAGKSLGMYDGLEQAVDT